MITGLGTDLVEVDRIAEAISKQNGFREMIFSAGEIAYCESNTNSFEHYAARFAAKEAFFKALGTGWAEGTSFNEVEVVHDNQGKPGIMLSGNTAAVVGPVHVLVSLTHIKKVASATVIIEK